MARSLLSHLLAITHIPRARCPARPLSMRFSAALLVGLGARIFLDIILHPPGHQQREAILTGIWQGVALYHTHANHLHSLFLVAFAISAWLMIDFALIQDVYRMTTILLGVALGVFCAGLLTQLESSFDNGGRSGAKHDHHNPSRLQSAAAAAAAVVSASKKHHRSSGQHPQHSRARIPVPPTVSDITAPSLDTSTDTFDSNPLLTPFEREVASLRMRASLADTERRRYREEKKWAISQGNVARAEQMRWQVKRYTTLMHSFNREADAMLLEANSRANNQQPPAAPSPRSRARRQDTPSEGQPSNGNPKDGNLTANTSATTSTYLSGASPSRRTDRSMPQRPPIRS